jgi:hypothetical protein
MSASWKPIGDTPINATTLASSSTDMIRSGFLDLDLGTGGATGPVALRIPAKHPTSHSLQNPIGAASHHDGLTIVPTRNEANEPKHAQYGVTLRIEPMNLDAITAQNRANEPKDTQYELTLWIKSILEGGRKGRAKSSERTQGCTAWIDFAD